jgi:uncharacterized protein YbaP (TraB family)
MMNAKNQILLFSFLIGFLLFATTLHAQLCWKVSGNDLTKPSYLFGTHHLIEKDSIAGFDKYLKLIDEVDAVIGELDMSNMMSIQMKLMQGGVMKDVKMKDLMSADDYVLVDNELKQVLGAGLDKLGVLKPMMLSSMYTVMMYMKYFNLKKQPEAIDNLFQKTARKQKKEVMALESVEEQMDILFNSIPLKRQAEILVEGVKTKDSVLMELSGFNKAYLDGDLQLLQDKYAVQSTMTEEESHLLLDKRNNNWIVQLKSLLPAKSCFVAVGCLHLTGETGLINQLRKLGYKVEAVQ